MPTYSFRNKETLQEYELKMKISEKEDYLKENPQVVQIFKNFPGIVDPVRIGLRKPDAGFRDVLKNVKSIHKKNNINDF